MPATQTATRPLDPVRARLSALCAALLLAGCASFPERAARPELRHAAAHASEQSFAAPLAQWPADDWWSAYGDAQLDRLIAEGLAGAPTIAVAA
ncbi:MAG: hypothetical protein JNJ60_09460, partial [Rhodocyclaceae bacterium]|nr:hypothetical protein [Rhodocyclaceae bacterium]